SKYFNGNPLYMDKERSFYSYLGNKSLFAQPLHTWNPFTLYHDYIALKDRLKAKDVDGNLKGEGFLKGGFLIVTPTEGTPLSKCLHVADVQVCCFLTSRKGSYEHALINEVSFVLPLSQE